MEIAHGLGRGLQPHSYVLAWPTMAPGVKLPSISTHTHTTKWCLCYLQAFNICSFVDDGSLRSFLIAWLITITYYPRKLKSMGTITYPYHKYSAATFSIYQLVFATGYFGWFNTKYYFFYYVAVIKICSKRSMDVYIHQLKQGLKRRTYECLVLSGA